MTVRDGGRGDDSGGGAVMTVRVEGGVDSEGWREGDDSGGWEGCIQLTCVHSPPCREGYSCTHLHYDSPLVEGGSMS